MSRRKFHLLRPLSLCQLSISPSFLSFFFIHDIFASTLSRSSSLPVLRNARKRAEIEREYSSHRSNCKRIRQTWSELFANFKHNLSSIVSILERFNFSISDRLRRSRNRRFKLRRIVERNYTAPFAVTIQKRSVRGLHLLELDGSERTGRTDVRGMIPTGISVTRARCNRFDYSPRCVTNHYYAHFDPVMPETPVCRQDNGGCHFIAKLGRSFVRADRTRSSRRSISGVTSRFFPRHSNFARETRRFDKKFLRKFILLKYMKQEKRFVRAILDLQFYSLDISDFSRSILI